MTTPSVGVFLPNQRSSDDPAYYVSIQEARQLRDSNEAFSINSGKDIRLLGAQPKDERDKLSGGTMRDAWQIRESAGYLVMQLRTERCEGQA